MGNPIQPITPEQAEFLRLEGITEVYSLQSLVELIYVRQGNELLGEAFTMLDTALTAAQGALSSLTDLQNLHNQVGIETTVPFSSLFDYKDPEGEVVYTYLDTNNIKKTETLTYDGADSYREVYNKLASNYYTPIDLTFRVTIPATATTPAQTQVITNSSSPGFADFRDQLAAARTQLGDFIEQLQGLADPKQKEGAAPLVQRLLTVYNQIPGEGASFDTIKAWVLDGNNIHDPAGVQNAGIVQRDLQTAITAAQSLNATQNQNVRRFMFQFQQYQQSAAAILSALNQLARSINSNISRT